MNDDINNLINICNTNILFEIEKKIGNIIVDLNNKGEINNIINQLKNIIKIINDNKKYFENIDKKLNDLNEKINNFGLLSANPPGIINFNFQNNNNSTFQGTKIYENGKYVGELKNQLRDGKGTFYFINGNKYNGDLKMIKWKEKGRPLITQMVTYMKE